MNIGAPWDLVGNTPLVKIESLSKSTGCNIFGKAEFLNPNGSVKDRAAKAIILQAEMEGKLRAGSTIVEGTAGNTGIGLAAFGIPRGYKVIITIPNNQADEKYKALQVLGVDLRLVEPCPFANQQHFYHYARTISESLPNSFWANQFENTANYKTHFQTTGPEIWHQLNGKVDAFTCSTGTGGTLSGVSQYLKQKNKEIFIQLADPLGSGLYSYFQTKELKANGSSVTEGIGIMRITDNFRSAIIDEAVQIDDSRMISMLFHLARNDGMFLGTSAALNCCAAFDLGMKWKNSGKTIVTILGDHGSRYQSKLLNGSWIQEKKLNISNEFSVGES